MLTTTYAEAREIMRQRNAREERDYRTSRGLDGRCWNPWVLVEGPEDGEGTVMRETEADGFATEWEH